MKENYIMVELKDYIGDVEVGMVRIIQQRKIQFYKWNRNTEDLDA